MYEFKESDAEDFARHINASTFIRGSELVFRTCPYCKSEKDKGTFSISLRTGQFECKRASCQARGNMITLAKDFEFDIGLATEYYNPRQYRNLKQVKPESKPKAVEYMLSRGISEEVTKKYNITTQKDNENVIVFPFYSESGRLEFIKYRNSAFQKGVSKGGKEWTEKDCKPILFGMNHCDPEKNKTLVITEGQMDSLSLSEAGIENAVSVPMGVNNLRWIPTCWDFIQKFDEIIVFGDYEKEHITLVDDVKARFSQKMIKHPRVEDYKDCKDANDILRKYGKETLQKAVENAEMVEDARVKPIVSVQRKSFQDVERFQTRIKALNTLTGGFYMGTLNILSGERGLGKSTLGDQFILDAIRGGFNTFLYSGELNDWQVRDWLELNIYGKQNLNRCTTEDGFVYYSTKGEYAQKVNSWYGSKAFIYDNSVVENGNENDSLIKVLEIAVQRYSCKVLMVDNLMTAISDDLGADFYRQQSNFVRDLKRLAANFERCVFLVAHPKKRSTQDWANDDISGSANITNLADVVMAYTNADDDSEADRKLVVTKNRITGRVNYEGIELYFEESSKRISENNQFDWTYGWEDITDGFTNFSEADEEDCPFV